MTKPALGVKRKCLECGTHFFDLQRDPIVCPRCKTLFVPPPPPAPTLAYKRKTQIPLGPTIATTELEATAENDPEVEPSDEDGESGTEDDREPEPDEDPDDDVLPLNE